MPKLTIEKLRETQAYQNLSAKNQQMVDIFLETGSKTKATLAVSSGHCKESSARSMAYQYFGKLDVRECLEVSRGVDPKIARAAAERLQWDADLNRLIGNKTTTRVQISALRLKAQVNGYILPAAMSEPSAEFQIGQRVTQRDSAGVLHVGIVRAVDANGRPSDIETVE